MQWCCAAGEWGLPHQLDLARWPYIQPRHLVRSLCSAASGLMPHPFEASPTLRRLPGFALESSKVCPLQFVRALPGQCSAGCHTPKTLAQLRPVLTRTPLSSGHCMCDCSGIMFEGALEPGRAGKRMAYSHTEAPCNL